ncbi:winged helix-turn-helix domain-containing protein [Canibacter sp. lx-72]|uniref:winged helix-turn-helix domain-containing protein n=1 Tax=Canibacter zhuwentaonis TaxID=2837491 RepID=UPI001BDDAC9E|nr:winged helix-turn-helix domain-containing protein [Canibacter zhuwentaonis]
MSNLALLTPAPAQISSEIATPERTKPHLQAVASPKEVRGFALYVGITDEQLAAGGTKLVELVAQLKTQLAELAPGAQSYTAVALAPQGATGDNVDVTRLALGEPTACARYQQRSRGQAEHGLVVDLRRRRVIINGESVSCTFREFALLRYLVVREGITVSREDIIENVWADLDAAAAPNARAIDVHVRRLRAKLGSYQELICTVRGAGYRFESVPGVKIISNQAATKNLRAI